MKIALPATFASLLALGSLASSADAALIITGVFDGPLTGGVPKGVELYATTDIADISTYSVSNYNNGGTTATATYTLSGSVSEGDFIYVAYDNGAGDDGFEAFFGTGLTVFIAPAINVNGDDAVGLLLNSVVVDSVGTIGADGTGLDWEYLDGWAYRKDGTGPDATFDSGDWTFSGINQLEGGTTNDTTTSPFPLGTYSPVPEPGAVLLGAIGLIGLLRRRR